MILRHDIGHSVALIDSEQDVVRWQYVYAGKPKPYIHPLRTPAGHLLSNFEPYDHIWHRGLWFTVKFVNGHNFWEEREPFGVQRTLAPPAITHGPQGQILLSTDLSWIEPEDTSVLIREHREITYKALANDAYALDWQMTLTPAVDVVLDRTPHTTWGGYGGLSLRGNRNWCETRMLLPDGTISDGPLGASGTWCDLAGKLDGGLDQTGGMAIFDHPENIRHPGPWHGRTGSKHYINAAFLFHESLTLSAGQPFTLRYRTLIHDGMWDTDRLQAAYSTYVRAHVAAP